MRRKLWSGFLTFGKTLNFWHMINDTTMWSIQIRYQILIYTLYCIRMIFMEKYRDSDEDEKNEKNICFSFLHHSSKHLKGLLSHVTFLEQRRSVGPGSHVFGPTEAHESYDIIVQNEVTCDSWEGNWPLMVQKRDVTHATYDVVDQRRLAPPASHVMFWIIGGQLSPSTSHVLWMLKYRWRWINLKGYVRGTWGIPSRNYWHPCLAANLKIGI